MCKLEICAQVPSCSHQPAREEGVFIAPVHLRTCNRHVCHGVHSACVDPDAGAVYLALCAFRHAPVGPWEDMPPGFVCVYVCARACARSRARSSAQVAGGVARVWRGGRGQGTPGQAWVSWGGGGGGAAQSGSARLRVRVVAELGSGDSRARSWERAEPQSPAASSPSIPLSLPSPGLASATASRGTVAEGERPERGRGGARLGVGGSAPGPAWDQIAAGGERLIGRTSRRTGGTEANRARQRAPPQPGAPVQARAPDPRLDRGDRRPRRTRPSAWSAPGAALRRRQRCRQRGGCRGQEQPPELGGRERAVPRALTR